MMRLWFPGGKRWPRKSLSYGGGGGRWSVCYSEGLGAAGNGRGQHRCLRSTTAAEARTRGDKGTEAAVAPSSRLGNAEEVGSEQGQDVGRAVVFPAPGDG